MKWTQHASVMVVQVQSADFASYEIFFRRETKNRPQLDERDRNILQRASDAGHARGLIHNNHWKGAAVLVEDAADPKLWELGGFVIADDAQNEKAASCLLSLSTLWALFNHRRVIGHIYEDNPKAIEIGKAAGWRVIGSGIYQGPVGPRPYVTMEPGSGVAVRWSADHLVKLATSGRFGFDDRLLDWFWVEICDIASGKSNLDF